MVGGARAQAQLGFRPFRPGLGGTGVGDGGGGWGQRPGRTRSGPWPLGSRAIGYLAPWFWLEVGTGDMGILDQYLVLGNMVVCYCYLV